MTTVQQVYREIRKHLTREDARYAAPKLVEIAAKRLAKGE
jgi:hypothetical protein